MCIKCGVVMFDFDCRYAMLQYHEHARHKSSE